MKKNQLYIFCLSIFLLSQLMISNCIFSFFNKIFKNTNSLQKVIHVNEIKLSNPLLDQESIRTVFDPFAYVMGITEKEFKAINPQEQQQICDQKNHTIINTKTGQSFACGQFEASAVKALREQFVSQCPQGSMQFNVIEGYDKPWENWFRYAVDIGSLQANADNKRALFQVASNFNALEGDGNPQSGIMSYLSPALYVQGEAAALSAMPGLMYRMYFIAQSERIFTKNENTINTTPTVSVQFGQLERQINFLQTFDGETAPVPYITVTNGYIDLSHVAFGWQGAGKMTDKMLKNYTDAIQVGVHKNIQVISGLGPQKNELPIYKAIKITNDDQIIHQVFTATANLAGRNQNTFERLARMLLNAAYQGTLYAASKVQTNKVFLTLIGGGVFNNKLSWIIDALEQAVKRVSNKKLTITLVIYHSQSYNKTEWNDAENRLLQLVTNTKGTWTRYKKDGIYQLMV